MARLVGGGLVWNRRSLIVGVVGLSGVVVLLEVML